MKKLLTFLLIVLMALPFTGCTPQAGAGNPGLFVVASHSLLGVLGRDREDVRILEEDDFGRVMFVYAGSTVTSDRPGAVVNILAVVIAQRTTRQYSYFYDGINFIIHEVDRPEIQFASRLFRESDIMDYFTEEQLEQLKVENSWNQELNEDRFFRVRAARGDKTRHMTYVSRDIQREIYSAISGASNVSLASVPLTMDRNGNVIYFMRGRRSRAINEWTFYPAFLFMFDGDGNLIEGTGVMELHDLWDYRDQLREFKELNGWSFTWR